MAAAASTHVDVLIVGAGLSGIGAACQLRAQHPHRTVAVLEGRAAVGGTWDLFRYPGIRSDSDMFTLGYRFRPWTDPKAIADGPAILRYINDTADEHGIRRLIRFNHRVTAASWDSNPGRWNIDVHHTDTGHTDQYTCSFLYLCTGYYRYDEGFSPTFPGRDWFHGPVIHPQHWPEDLDCTRKRIVVIGSGATAITLVPALTATAEHVTMLQRSPSYVMALPGQDRIADWLRARLPQTVAYPIIRWKNALMGMATYQLSRRRPAYVKKMLRNAAIKQLPDGYDVDRHFTPTYNPWDQRMCLAPDGDLFTAIRSGHATIVTDRIDTFTESGIQLVSGKHLDADIIVSATGLNLVAVGGMILHVDGTPIDLADTIAYKGMMFSGVPNLAWTLGYTNASWTLKADLVAQYVCRLLAHMDRHHHTVVTPNPCAASAGRPLLDLNSGYINRSLAIIPKQGDKTPWRLHQNYIRDVALLRRGPVDDDVIFTRTPTRIA